MQLRRIITAWPSNMPSVSRFTLQPVGNYARARPRELLSIYGTNNYFCNNVHIIGCFGPTCANNSAPTVTPGGCRETHQVRPVPAEGGDCGHRGRVQAGRGGMMQPGQFLPMFIVELFTRTRATFVSAAFVSVHILPSKRAGDADGWCIYVIFKYDIYVDSTVRRRHYVAEAHGTYNAPRGMGATCYGTAMPA